MEKFLYYKNDCHFDHVRHLFDKEIVQKLCEKKRISIIFMEIDSSGKISLEKKISFFFRSCLRSWDVVNDH